MTGADARHRVARAVGSLAVVAALSESSRRARTGRVGPVEERVFRSVNAAPESLRTPVWAVMQAGSLAAVFVTGGALARAGRVPAATATTLAGTAVWAGGKVVKARVGRGRPEALLDGVRVIGHPQSGLGFPSGHAAVATTLALLVPPADSASLRAAALSLAATVGGARMYVGAHLPLDVVGGLALGVLAGQVARAVLDATS